MGPRGWRDGTRTQDLHTLRPGVRPCHSESPESLGEQFGMAVLRRSQSQNDGRGERVFVISSTRCRWERSHRDDGDDDEGVGALAPRAPCARLAVPRSSSTGIGSCGFVGARRVGGCARPNPPFQRPPALPPAAKAAVGAEGDRHGQPRSQRQNVGRPRGHADHRRELNRRSAHGVAPARRRPDSALGT